MDPAQFHDGLSRSLAEGSFRLVIVLDSAPDELIQVVGYLQLVTDKIDIDLVTVTAYEVGGSRVLVPQRIEPARRAREMPDAAVTARQSGPQTAGSGEFRRAIEEAPAESRDDLRRLANWAEALEAEALGAKITQGNATRAFPDELLTALTNAYRQAAANPEVPVIQVAPERAYQGRRYP